MKCPYCGCVELKVIDSRPNEDTNSIRRRRECLNCANRFTTYEKIESVTLIVVKKDRTREPFNREKILNGAILACQKRPVSIEQLERMVNEIEQHFSNTLDREISTDKIGEMVMDMLKEIDEIAYIRFASVYRRFTDISSFMEELTGLLKDNKNG